MLRVNEYKLSLEEYKPSIEEIKVERDAYDS
jgi:hypothetical protein